jgi:ribosomal protein L11 methyltransferase
VPWRALSLEVAAAHAESLSDALVEQGAQSVWIGEPGRTRLQINALFDARADAAALLGAAARAAGCAPPAYRAYDVADEDWVRATQAQFRAQCIAGRLWIVPSWDAPPPGAGVVLRLDPGLAFGTGSHPSTRLVLGWLAAADLAHARVLDYGCGSGILAIAAARLDAAGVDAVDVDADALGATSDNARANDVAVGAYAPEQLPPGDYDIVVANILAQPLIVLEPLLAARTRAGGRLALSGILDAQADEVTAAYGAHFAARIAAREEGWALVEGVRR